MTITVPTVPDTINFEQAIVVAEILLDHMERQQLSIPEVANTVAKLVQTEAGARGWFVTYLPDPRPLADQAPPELVDALRSSPDIVAELMVKNLVMSTAMILHHQRRHSDDDVVGSQRVQTRSAQLLQQLQLSQIRDRVAKLLNSLTTGEGEYQAFLTRWGYDDEQKQAMSEILRRVVPEA